MKHLGRGGKGGEREIDMGTLAQPSTRMLSSTALSSQSAMVEAIKTVDRESENRPDQEPPPRVGRQEVHHQSADCSTECAGHRCERHAERARHVWSGIAKH